MNDMASRKRKNIIIVFVAVIATAILAIVTDNLYFSNLEWRFRTSRLDKVLRTRETESADLLHNIVAEIAGGHDIQYLLKNETFNTEKISDIILLVYYNGRLAYWSDNSVSFPELYEDTFETHDPIFLSNGWFIPVHSRFQGYDLVSLIAVYRQYPIINDLLNSGFPDDYKVPVGTEITFEKNKSSFYVTGVEGSFHFGLLFPGVKPNTAFIIVPIFFWFIFLLLWIYFVSLIVRWMTANINGKLAQVTGGLMILLAYFLLIIAGVPPSVKSTELFSPFIINAGWILPSLGHLLLLSILLASILYIAISNGQSVPLRKESRGLRLALPVIITGAAFGFFLITDAAFRSVITRSTLNFEAYKILDVNLMSLVGYVAVIILLSISVILFIRAFRLMKFLSIRKKLLIIITGFMIVPLACLAGSGCGFWAVIYIVVLAAALLIWSNSTFPMYSFVVIYSVLTGIYSTTVIKRQTNIRDTENMKVLSVSLANDNDMVAESLLIDMWPEMKSDTLLRELMNKEYFSSTDINLVYRYLQSRYFIGYWENYDINILICRDDSPLQIPDQGSYASNCFLYFDERIKNEGDSITGTGFWFMHNLAGRAYYVSRLFYDYSPFLTNGLFIELISHIETFQAGYPELLINGSSKRFLGLRDISYAKYVGGVLVLQSGDYPYDNLKPSVKSDGGEYQVSVTNGYKHLYYKSGDKVLVITKEVMSPINTIVTFAYLFITLLIFSFLLLLIFYKREIKLLTSGTFKRKLQLAFAGVLSIVFSIIITMSVMLMISQFKGNHTKNLREKIASISIELDHKLANEKSLTSAWRTPDYFSLNELLMKFSNVFMTDINLYSPSGSLLASSRPEVFTEKLEGTMIDPRAYHAMTVEGKQEFIGEEKIGELKYLSAYVSFYNKDNQLLAYINLPYFSMQNLLTGEISNMVVTIINFTLMFLMLMMWLSVFLSERLTSPMILLQRAMASVEYGKKNEYIHYKSRDEVGQLVRQYNRMIDELDESAGKLARSEREMAWREMARQIAHEIKNPLTPMKLNVQQLQKWWKDEAPDFSTKLERFTDNQIEYIDNLSSIASAFSYFARLPGAEPAEVDVITQLGASIEMFGHTDDATISLDSGNISKAVVMADKEHLNGIFSNLVKNALQAIPPGVKGIVNVTVSATFDKLLIVFRDNGVGIPDELKPRMFTPNFTTKSSGMGLGLSIVKRYIETAGGNIWFESERGKGTAFFVELPLLYTVERLNRQSG